MRKSRFTEERTVAVIRDPDRDSRQALPTPRDTGLRRHQGLKPATRATFRG
jgi:hypothetical protein